jgi:hypothetical protein
MKILIWTLFFSLQFITTSAYAKESLPNPRLDEYFEELSHEKVDFEPSGMVCERVAVREIESLYPSENYNIINGISYDQNKTTIGELDVVILDKITGNVEVKCWTSFSGALKKAKNQRMRFQTYLNRNIDIYDKNGKRYSKNLFQNIQKYFTISQAGGVNQGFDFELSLTYKELMKLRSRLLDCKAQGRCPVR